MIEPIYFTKDIAGNYHEANLEAHDAKVREPLEARVRELEAVLVCPHNVRWPHACDECAGDEMAAHDDRVRREALEGAAEKCATAYWQSVAPKGVGAMHPSLQFWRVALGLPVQTDEEIDASIERMVRLASHGSQAIMDERRRQIEKEGWTPEHDDEHERGELAAAAACYAATATEVEVRYQGSGMPGWPWGRTWWKPKDVRSNLVRAGALIAAEIDRLDRKAAILGPFPTAPREEETK